MIDERYKLDTLFLLVGKNTLPNYVAAQLLLRRLAESRLILVYSRETASQRQRLEDMLKDAGFQQPVNVQVEESNPIDIENKIRAILKGLTGKVGLHYTGGTKVMAVHAYRVLDQALPDVQFSYLDARSLSVVFAHDKTPHPVGTAVPISLDVLLGLHSRTVSFKPDPLWGDTAQEIARLHVSDDSRAAWHIWVAKTFFKEPEWPTFHGQPAYADDVNGDEQWKQWVRELCVWQPYNQRTWDEAAKTSKRLDISDFQQVRDVWTTESGFGDARALSDVLRHAQTRHVGSTVTPPGSLRKAFKDVADLGKWFEGEWLESYVLQHLQHLQRQEQHGITDACRDLQAHGGQQVQIDVAFTRGYQLFALACTTAANKGLCKSKLLEVVVRAEQLGGAEARCALICCSPEPKTLEKEVADLAGEHVRVFGRDDLPHLQARLGDWIRDVSGR